MYITYRYIQDKVCVGLSDSRIVVYHKETSEFLALFVCNVAVILYCFNLDASGL